MTEFDENNSNFTTEDTMSTPIYLSQNDSDLPNGTNFIPERDYIYDEIYIRIIFISLYTVVFCLCFFGKSNFVCNEIIARLFVKRLITSITEVRFSESRIMCLPDF